MSLIEDASHYLKKGDQIRLLTAYYAVLQKLAWPFIYQISSFFY
jgi:hypothetical protein